MATAPHIATGAFARGAQDALRGILAVGRYDAPRPMIRGSVGSLATDRLARYRDMDAFAADVRRGRQDVPGDDLVG